jgi:hypothetical protein
MIKLVFKIFALLAGFTLLAKRDNWPAGATDSDVPVSPGRAPTSPSPSADASILGLAAGAYDTPDWRSRTEAMPIRTDPALKPPARYRFRATIESDTDTYEIDIAGNEDFIRAMTHSFTSGAVVDTKGKM